MPRPVPGLGRRQPDVPPRHRVGNGGPRRPARIEGEVPLSETFGYSTDLRSMTQGQGTFTMEFARYKRLPRNLEETDCRAEEGRFEGLRFARGRWNRAAQWAGKM